MNRPASPYRVTPPSLPGEPASSTRVASIALLLVVAAWALLGDHLRGGSELIVGGLVSGVALLAAWRAGQGSRPRSPIV